MRLPTASELPRVFACHGSAVLPRVQASNIYSDAGTAIHRFLHAARKAGRAVALADMPGEYRARCEAIDIAALPIGGEPEVAYAWDHGTGAGRRLGVSLGRDYARAKPTEYVGTADLISVDGSTVRVWDYKTGFQPVPPDSWQLKFLGLAAARAEGCDAAEVGIIKIGDDGKVYVTTLALSAMDLDVIALELERLAGRVRELAEIPIDRLPLVSGPHCNYCPAFMRCPAKVAMIRAVAANVETVTDDWITPATVGKVYAFVEQAKRALAVALERCEEIARHTPVPLPDGRVLKLVATSRESFDATVAYGVIANGYGPEIAIAAVEQKATKASIKRALGTRAEAAIDAIREAGGVMVDESEAVKVVSQ